MPAALQDFEDLLRASAANAVDKTMLIGDPTRPIAFELALKKHWACQDLYRAVAECV